MKFPNAIFASVVGTTRSKERSYGWRGTSAGNGASAYGIMPSLALAGVTLKLGMLHDNDWIDAHPYCRNNGVSQLTAAVFHT